MQSKGKLQAMGERPLTWQQVIAVLGALGVFFFGLFVFAEGDDAEAFHRVAWIGLPISAAFLTVFTWLHLRRVRRPDLLPDVLAQMVPVDQILQLGLCHLYIAARPCGVGVEIGAFVQNMADGLGTLRLQFKPPFSLLGNSIIIPELECEVPPGAVINAHGRFACDIDRLRTRNFYLEGNFHSTGKQVRFARRTALTMRLNPIVSAGLVLLSHWHHSGGTYIEISSDVDGGEDQVVGFDSQWTTTLIWSPQSEAAETPRA